MRQTAIGIIFVNGRKSIILTKRRDVPVWVLPGGGVDPHETPEEAVIREVAEETGLSVAITRKTAEYSPVNRLSNLTHVFECEPIGGTLTLTNETSGVSAFDLNALPDTFFIIHKEWLNDALNSDKALIKKELTNVTYARLASYFLGNPLLVIRYFFSWIGLPFNSR